MKANPRSSAPPARPLSATPPKGTRGTAAGGTLTPGNCSQRCVGRAARLHAEEVGDAVRALELEQCALDRQAAAKTRERAVGADHPMTRHDDRQWIRAVRESNRARDAPDPARELAVGDRLAVGNRLERPPYRAL